MIGNTKYMKKPRPYTGAAFAVLVCVIQYGFPFPEGQRYRTFSVGSRKNGSVSI